MLSLMMIYGSRILNKSLSSIVMLSNYNAMNEIQ